MSLIDHSARVSYKRSGLDGITYGKYLYVRTDSVFPGSLSGFWSPRKVAEDPEPEGSVFNFSRSDFYWHSIGSEEGYAILLTLDLTLGVVCSCKTQRQIAEALFAPRRDSLFHVPLAPWFTDIPEVQPADARDVLSG